MNTQTYYQLIQDWKGTPMETVIHIMNSGEYRDSKEKVIENNIIDEMTPLEKAIFTRLTILEEEMKQQLSSTATEGCAGDVASVNCFDCVVYKGKTCPVYQQIHQIHVTWHKDTEPLKTILAKLIYDRIPIAHLFVAERFLIVSREKESTSNYEKKTGEVQQSKTPQMLFEESIAGTFLQAVVDIMESEEFIDSDVPVEEGQKIISDLKSFEQAVFSLMTKERQSADEILQKLVERDDPHRTFACLETLVIWIGEGDMPEEIDASIKKMGEHFNTYMTLKDIFYGLMENPILEDISSGKVCPIIRKGFKLVACNRE